MNNKDKQIDLVSNFINQTHSSLIKVGEDLYRGYCPFCNDSIPSIFISKKFQEYNCLSCGANGNITNFIMKKEDTDFFGTVKYLTGKSVSSDNYNKDLEVFYKMNIDAAEYFYKNLYDKEDNKGLSYWYKRGLTDETIRRFGLGYTGYGSRLYFHLKNNLKLSPVKMLDNGLVVKRDKKYYDFFYNRVIIPILDMNGKVIGFGGRTLGDEKPKYINTKETAVFDKRLNLFALNLAKRSKRDGLILCEGYLDVISMHQAGFDNAVASLGTALTDEQAYLISRITNHVYLAYDSDNAGIEATEKAYKLLQRHNIKIKFIILDKKDPDEFIKSYGNKAFEQKIRQACYYEDYIKYVKIIDDEGAVT